MATIPTRRHETVLAQLANGLSTDHLYDLLAATLTELAVRDNVDGTGPARLELTDGRVDTEFAEIRFEADERRFMSVFFDEGSAQCAAEQGAAR